ncbi:GCN5-related N-acetyltransferase 5 [Hibiscus trionum]|uniref:GCN5-related N-acetyltransferase 5 n=1 Tax=Hibiscus trionum TaxID=183268 RepID=A0A9W7I6P0_HIBTR|nr:GCN5-related N-acetyltransferase 5 [Hibiscus trionum]
MATTAAAFSPSLYLDPKQHQQHLHIHLNLTKPLPFLSSRKNPLLPLQRLHLFNCRCSLPSSSSTNSVAPSHHHSFLDDPFRGTRFLSNEELEKLKALESFVYLQDLESGSLSVRVMRTEEMDSTAALLAESFAESMLMPLGYGALMRFLVKQYLIERRAVLPHAVTLVGYFRQKDGEKGNELAGTVEVCFDKSGDNASPPTPLPPQNSPYICNMTVTKHLRRKGIGWHLLKASEELISRMASSKEVYLHCRMIDEAPFNMYMKAGYDVVRTDNILILLTLQRRKHLMCKKLPVSESDMSDSGEELMS